MGTTGRKQRAQRRHIAAVVAEKLDDVMVPGFAADFTPEEADLAGAFADQAMEVEVAADSHLDLLPPDS